MRIRRFITRHLFWLVTIVTLLISGAIGFYAGQKKIFPLPNITQKTQTCRQEISENPQRLTVYVTDNWFSNILIPSLCENEIVRRQFGDVKVITGTNDFDTFKHINYGIADLALVKDHSITAFASEKVHGYQVIAQYPDYPAFFIARNEKPIITKEYILGKRIGLLDYPSSRSGHIIPKIVLQELGLNSSNTDILYYNSHSELRQRLLVGDVDIIASYWDETDNEQFSVNYRTQLDANIRGSRWFLKQQSRNVDLICALQRELAVLSEKHRSDYYQGIQLINECKND